MGIKLLLADDSITIQKVVGIIFAGEEYELTIVDNGNAAIDKAKEVLPDLMLVDALMPGKNGYEVCQAVRQDSALQQLPLLLLTGAFEPFDEEKARQCGADDFITKPFESQQLMERVNKLLSLAKERPVAAATVGAPPAEELVADQDDWAAMTAPDLAPLPDPTPVEPVAAPVSFASFGAVIEEPAEAEAESTIVQVEQTPPADDLWGAFEMEEIPAAEAGAEVQELTASQLVSTGEDKSVGLEEPAAIVGDWGAAPVVDELPEPTTMFAAEPEASVIGFSEDAFVVEPEVETPAVPEPAFAAAAFADPIIPEPVVEVPPPAVEAVTTPALAPAVGSITLSDDQLAELVAKISRDVIERIAWEVVPDLAETIIKEEIRKIKEGR